MTSVAFIVLVSKVPIELIKKITGGLFSKNAEKWCLIEISDIIYIMKVYVAFIIICSTKVSI